MTNVTFEQLPHVLLFTGQPGIGKTTLLKKIVNQLDPQIVTGFYTNEIRIEGRRQGFQIVMIGNDQKGLLASPEIQGGLRFGTLLPDGTRRLGITLEFLENVACPAISNIPEFVKLVVIDEIGPIQVCSPIFRQLLDSLLKKELTILASISDTDEPWISSIRQRSDVALFMINKSNRDLLGTTISLFLSRKLDIPLP